MNTKTIVGFRLAQTTLNLLTATTAVTTQTLVSQAESCALFVASRCPAGFHLAHVLLKFLRKSFESTDIPTLSLKSTASFAAIFLQTLSDSSSTFDVFVSTILAETSAFSLALSPFPIIFLLDVLKTGKILETYASENYIDDNDSNDANDELNDDSNDDSNDKYSNDSNDGSLLNTIHTVLKLLRLFSDSIESHIPEICRILKTVTNPHTRRKSLHLLEFLVMEKSGFEKNGVKVLQGIKPFLEDCVQENVLSQLSNPNNIQRCELWNEYHDISMNRQSLRQLISLILACLGQYTAGFTPSLNLPEGHDESLDKTAILHHNLKSCVDLFANITFTPELLDMIFVIVSESDSFMFQSLLSLTRIAAIAQSSPSQWALLNQEIPSLKIFLPTDEDGNQPNLIHALFAKFINQTGKDVSILVDFLMSSETEFLEFLLVYIKYATATINSFEASSIFVSPALSAGPEKSRSCDYVVEIVSELCEKLGELSKDRTGGGGYGLFPYNPAPLIRRIQLFLDTQKQRE
ncbi:hypothetical protein HK100_001952 [Physocladia obscura]|uniref:Protein Lines N-terminal domain-containing protein n=1 Tax=Physocladia obscura TaxID=109957 RepID=A0AAD5TA28_9FUNG|nr:hypothetical protein HK100_001952 [Physocladia obscura]